MKYIRTKEAIFELVNEHTHTSDVEGLEGKEFYEAWQPERISLNLHKYSRSVEVLRVIKFANTIEELCDEFVVHTWEDGKKVCNSLYFVKTIYMKNGNYDEIYGAIWTDKGLIYVAKMNDKGELCLL